MGAAAEGCVFGVPSMGVSLLDHHPDADFTECCRLGRMVARRVLKEGLPAGTYLNLNVPKVDTVKGMKICRQAAGKMGEGIQTLGKWCRQTGILADRFFRECQTDSSGQRYAGTRQRICFAGALQTGCDGLRMDGEI